jgi:hypothetical protein
MKKVLSIVMIMLFMLNLMSPGQVPDIPPDSKPAPTNAPGLEFPRVDSQLRATFRIEALNAEKVQPDLGSVYNIVSRFYVYTPADYEMDLKKQ